jgi:hypothetical protein
MSLKNSSDAESADSLLQIVSGLLQKEHEDLFTPAQELQKKFIIIRDGLIEQGLNENSGKTGSMRKAVHQVEEVFKNVNDSKLLVLLLTIRPHEKDYFLRGDQKYLKKKAEAVEQLSQAASQSSLNPEIKTIILQKLSDYTLNFQSLTKQIETNKQSDSESQKIAARMRPALQLQILEKQDIAQALLLMLL